jgi:hypothetical protein
MQPWQSRALLRSRGLACDLRGVRKLRSTSKASRPARHLEDAADNFAVGEHVEIVHHFRSPDGREADARDMRFLSPT